jgi:hypothetical protein
MPSNCVQPFSGECFAGYSDRHPKLTANNRCGHRRFNELKSCEGKAAKETD